MISGLKSCHLVLENVHASIKNSLHSFILLKGRGIWKVFCQIVTYQLMYIYVCASYLEKSPENWLPTPGPKKWHAKRQKTTQKCQNWLQNKGKNDAKICSEILVAVSQNFFSKYVVCILMSQNRREYDRSSDWSIKVKLSDLLGNYDRKADKPTNRQTDKVCIQNKSKTVRSNEESDAE